MSQTAVLTTLDASKASLISSCHQLSVENEKKRQLRKILLRNGYDCKKNPPWLDLMALSQPDYLLQLGQQHRGEQGSLSPQRGRRGCEGSRPILSLRVQSL